MTPITVLAPTGTLGYGFGADALKRGMDFKPGVIAVDAGSTDPGPHYLGSGEVLVSRFSYKKELTELMAASRAAGIPLVVGSAGGSGSRPHVDFLVEIVREVARDLRLNRFKLAWIYADIEPARIKQAIANGEVKDFEAGFALTADLVDSSTHIVAQMGFEPIIKALQSGADVVIAGRACDDAAIAAYPIMQGGHKGLAMHMGKILECGAFSAVPFAMDVMMGFLKGDSFELEPGSVGRRASLTSVAAHTLYERENPFDQHGPGYRVDLHDCRFEQAGERRVRVSGAKFIPESECWIKLEGARQMGFRSICVAGIRCPTMIVRIDEILAAAKEEAVRYMKPHDVQVTFHVYGKDGVMRALEPQKKVASHELGLIIEVVASEMDLAHAACHHISGGLLHTHYKGQLNTSGNLAFPYSPSELDAGPAYAFSAYHLMKVRDPYETFPIHYEDV
ncbi:MAG: acyclic terpene utilization AtuA family protein [Alphaproteobacteria bacterium]|nr:acyclic terpene utilization AtuA family protein [Alphaproteobacteria bacterium]